MADLYLVRHSCMTASICVADVGDLPDLFPEAGQIFIAPRWKCLSDLFNIEREFEAGFEYLFRSPTFVNPRHDPHPSLIL